MKNAFFIARDFIFSGSYTQLWYLPATIVAVFPVWILKKMKVRWQAALALAVILYGIGLLGQTYYGLLEMIVGEHESVWMVLRFIMLIIATTRNGIFFGFLFILLGALVAEGKIMLSRRGAGIGFIVSMILFLGEAVLLRHMNWVKDGNMYIFMIPAVLCLFLLVSGWEPKKDMDYKRLRENSTLVFFIHLWVAAIIAGVWNRIMQIYHIGRMNSMCQFLLVTIFSVLLSFGIIKLSKKITILRNIY